MPYDIRRSTIILNKTASKIIPGDHMVNLGQVLEIELGKTTVSIVILRMQEKQVFLFPKKERVLIYFDQVENTNDED